LKPSRHTEERRAPADLPALWRDQATDLRSWGADAQALVLERVASELEAAFAQQNDETVTLTEAARISGYHPDHIGRMVRDGDIPNAGRKHAPRVRLGDVPRKAGALPEPSSKQHISRAALARAVVNDLAEGGQR
jgi:hypothetical protein